MTTKTLYKYRSLNNFEYFLDILVNNRLHASSYEEKNDAMEGVYYNAGLSRNTLKRINEEKINYKILSLSKDADNILMWSHYADGSRGVNIEVEVTAHNVDVREIVYDGMAEIAQVVNEKNTAEEILTHKHSSWSYEQEVRVFTRNSFVTIKILRIILGKRISKNHKKLIKDLVNKINPKIEVIDYKQFRNLYDQ